MEVSMNELAAIGDLTVTWNSVEEHLQWFIWEVAGWDEEIGSAVTTDLGNVSRIQLALNLSNLRLTTQISDVDIAMKFMEICRSKRNDVIHALPMAESNEPRVLRKYSTKAGTGLRQKTDTPIDVVVLQTIIQDMMRLIVALVGLHKMAWMHSRSREEAADYPSDELVQKCAHLSWTCIEPLRKRLGDLYLERQNSGKNLHPLEFSQD